MAGGSRVGGHSGRSVLNEQLVSERHWVGFPSLPTWRASCQHLNSLPLVSGEEDIRALHIPTHPHIYIHKHNTHAHHTHTHTQPLEPLLMHLGHKLWKLGFAKIPLWIWFFKDVCCRLWGTGRSESASFMGPLTMAQTPVLSARSQQSWEVPQPHVSQPRWGNLVSSTQFLRKQQGTQGPSSRIRARGGTVLCLLETLRAFYVSDLFS